MHIVFSTMTGGVDYWTYTYHGDLPERDKVVRIKGGSNVATKELMTPLGVATTIDDEQMALLEKHPLFQIHLRNGFVKVEKKKIHVEKAIVDMNKKDSSAPRTPSDYKESKKGFLTKSSVPGVI